MRAPHNGQVYKLLQQPISLHNFGTLGEKLLMHLHLNEERGKLAISTTTFDFLDHPACFTDLYSCNLIVPEWSSAPFGSRWSIRGFLHCFHGHT